MLDKEQNWFYYTVGQYLVGGFFVGGRKNNMNDLTPIEAYAIAEFIDMNRFTAIRNDEDWDSVQNLRNLIHGYEKCCMASGYVGLTEHTEEEE